jgi:alpha-1,6-mannosyltransferase
MTVSAPALVFVALYSFLPHKELRFIFPALTLINLAAAMGLCKIVRMLSKNKCFNYLLCLGAIILLVGSFSYSQLLTYVSYHNYPGGNAMKWFNKDYLNEIQNNPSLPTPYIHIDVYPAMTGITRFSYENEEKYNWRYNRTEHLTKEQ